ncbi:MAG TPA: siroheme synthase CysG [Steroidobacteraceae bacterium]|nr:siroheme synthase CysG [Steroidobacteraceae bacterium]
MDYLPVFLRVESQPVLVVGGGAVALRKAESLLQAGARVTVVAPQLCAPLAARAARGGLTHLATEFRPEHLAGAVAAVAATDDPAVNSAVSQAARARAVPVNVVDDAALSSFIFPAIIDRSPILVAVSSSGAAPVLARRVRAQIEALLPARLGALASFMGAQRARVRQTLRGWARRPFWERVAHGAVATRVLAGDEAGARTTLDRELHAARLIGTAPAAPLGEVYLIGAGPGDPDLLTLRALQLLQQADVILYDRLVAPEVLQRARRDAECIFVGKEAGDSDQQEHIHALLVRLALAGKRVARLKGGDPFVFGRGGEELERLAAHGIPYVVVPGITAALGAAAAAEVPLTHRRLAHSVTLVNGHGATGSAAEWRFFADPAHTVVFYMGVAQLARIVARLRAAGAAAEHPVAIIERATLPAQRVLRSTLAAVSARAAERQIQPPALLITGNVAAFAAADALGALGAAAVPADAVA